MTAAGIVARCSHATECLVFVAQESWKSGNMERVPKKFHHSITFKIGLIFLALALTCGALLLASSYQTTQLMGTSAAVNLAGMQRARAYKLGALVQRLQNPSLSSATRTAVIEEIARWKRALSSLEGEFSDEPGYGALRPVVIPHLAAVREQWTGHLEPALEAAMQAGAEESAQAARRYLRRVDGFVEALSALVRALEQSREDQIHRLFVAQISFVLVLLLCAALAIVLLKRLILNPLDRLTWHAERLSAGDLRASIPDRSPDEFGQLAQAFERLRLSIVRRIDELEALHAVGQEMNSLDPKGLDTVLRCIVDRAADLLKADVALLLVRHPALDCWIVEGASGSAFETMRRKIVLLEETPFSNRAFESKLPVAVSDITLEEGTPGRFREEFGARSFLAVPLIRINTCTGVLLFMNKGAPRSYSDWDVRLAQHFAAYAAVSLENVQLFYNVTSEAEELRHKLEAMRRSVAELTHEVKAPAGRVAEFASWLEEDYAPRLDDKGRRYLDWIRKEGQDLAQLAEKALDLPRLAEAPRAVESVDVRSVAEEVLHLLKHQIEQGAVHVDLARGFPRFACQRIHLKQVLENLVSNAIKFMGARAQPRIEIGWTQSDEGPWLFVRDNGVGIESGMLPRIFEPFQRLGQVEAPGAGVGLAIVRSVVEQYGGAVKVTSTPGMGSTFFVRLPAMIGTDSVSTPEGAEPATDSSRTLAWGD